jgi:hypothetical protein
MYCLNIHTDDANLSYMKPTLYLEGSTWWSLNHENVQKPAKRRFPENPRFLHFFRGCFRALFLTNWRQKSICLGGLVGGSIWAPSKCQKHKLFWVSSFRPSSWPRNGYKSCVWLRRGAKSSLLAYQIPTPARLSVTMVLKINTKTCMMMTLTLWMASIMLLALMQTCYLGCCCWWMYDD